ncbi:PREDICTED: translation initiation factor IF-2-like [Chinchilla lanigera]|uniref:translation initiation factor IF-2-like n=1 Tax=Chinchilla lanigera TaxID=34839 RepID=UPI000696CB72|nr:PREDICTED: translation initiation factor IF-2-like [Chinchilla lanigera]
MQKKGGTASLLPLPLLLPSDASRPAAPKSPADKKGLCNKMARRHRHTQQGKEPRCPRPPPPLLHRGRSQSPDRSPRPQGPGVWRREGRGRAGWPRPPQTARARARTRGLGGGGSRESQCVHILLGYVTGPRANGRAGQHGMERLHMDTPRRQPSV